VNFWLSERNLYFEMTDSLDRIAFRLLVLRCQTGDGAAFADLVRQHNGRLAGYLQGLLGRDPSDALQDVWLAIWRGLPRLADAEAFAAWAFRIARDRAFRELRRERLLTVLVGDVADVETDEFDNEDAAAVRAAVDRLPVVYRDVLLLRYVEGLSYEAIARVVGVPVGTIRSRLFHAKRRMRELLQPEAGHD
jgi:RNA polymerase sigma-70 factor (ECF subfamily)